MKKTIVLILIGFIPIILLFFGITIKNADYPNGEFFIWFSCICFPPAVAYIVFKLRLKPENARKIAYFLGVISMGYLALAFLFNGLRLAGSDLFIVAGVTSFALLFLPFLFRSIFLKD